MPATPLARYASLNNFVELTRSFGLDPAAMVRDAGLDPAGLDTPDRWAPAAAIAELLERAAGACGREDLGIRLAELRRFSNLGPLSLVVREEPDVRSALRILTRYEHLYNEALHIHLAEADAAATIRVRLDLPEALRRQSTELAVGVLYRLMRAFLGATWQPVAVGFTHRPPRHDTIHHRALGPVVRFGEDYDGLRVHTRDLDAPNAVSDPVLRGYARRLLGSIETGQRATTLDRVRELVEVLLPTGRCSVEHVARSLGVDRRTVHRDWPARGRRSPHSSTPPAATSPRGWYAGGTGRSPRSPRCSDSPPTATSPAGSGAGSVQPQPVATGSLSSPTMAGSRGFDYGGPRSQPSRPARSGPLAGHPGRSRGRSSKGVPSLGAGPVRCGPRPSRGCPRGVWGGGAGCSPPHRRTGGAAWPPQDECWAPSRRRAARPAVAGGRLGHDNATLVLTTTGTSRRTPKIGPQGGRHRLERRTGARS